MTLQKYGSVEKVIQARRQLYKKHFNKYNKFKNVNSEIKCIQYVRYVDDLLIGIIGNRSFAIQLQKTINSFINNTLYLNVKKDFIIHRNNGAVKFLDHDIRLKEFKKKYNTLPKIIQAARQHKKKSFG